MKSSDVCDLDVCRTEMPHIRVVDSREFRLYIDRGLWSGLTLCRAGQLDARVTRRDRYSTNASTTTQLALTLNARPLRVGLDRAHHSCRWVSRINEMPHIRVVDTPTCCLLIYVLRSGSRAVAGCFSSTFVQRTSPGASRY
jgi:hypothetical protein